MSVISSEMSATASPEFLRAHAVISRSWLLAQIDKTQRAAKTHDDYNSCTRTDTELAAGATAKTTPTSTSAPTTTASDTRASPAGPHRRTRSRGEHPGTRSYRRRRPPLRRPLLKMLRRRVRRIRELLGAQTLPLSGGTPRRHQADGLPPTCASRTTRADGFSNAPEAYCKHPPMHPSSARFSTTTTRETHDFYRWTVTHSQQELADLIRRRSGIDFGTIRAPRTRGTRHLGTPRPSPHRRHKAHNGDRQGTRNSPHTLHKSPLQLGLRGRDRGHRRRRPSARFTLRGAGWGHGVGLCRDRRRRDGRPRPQPPRNPAPLLPRSHLESNILIHNSLSLK